MPATLSDGHQYMMKLTKKADGSFTEERGLGVKYVPLTSKEAQFARKTHTESTFKRP